MNSSQRLEILISKLGLSKSEFALKVGKLPQNINSYTKGGRNVGKNFALDIKKSFPIVNSNWLLYGSGEIFISEYQNQSEKELINEINYLKNELDTLNNKYKIATNFIKKINKEGDDILRNN
jgi:phage repressor protein C with HTH and peptisase S24 domain